MIRVLNCLAVEHDWRLVILAALVCFLASLAAITMFHRARVAEGRARLVWVLAAGVATGCGIWATHFIAMLAYDPGISMAYDLGRTVLSLIAAVMVTLIGFALAIYDPGRWSAPIGGALVGGGVAVMHYLGMSAVVLGGRIAWDPGLVAASILLGIAFGAASLAIAKRGDNATSIVAAALLLTLAIVSHHFTAMGAVLLMPDPTQVIDPLSISPMSLAVGIAATAIAVLGISLIGAIADRRMADRAVEAAARFYGLAEATTEALVICDGDTIADVNSSLERLIGAPAQALTGKPIETLLPVIANGVADPGKPTGEVLVRAAGGELIACEASSRTIPHGSGVRTVISLRDVRERKRAEARIIHLAMHDPLTDLPNRLAFTERLAEILAGAERTGAGFALLCLDFDRFKEVNDLFGHQVGDLVLCEVGRRLSAAAAGAYLARLGGDEFTLIAEGPQPGTAAALAERLQACVAEDIVIDGRGLRIGLSVGAAVYPEDGLDAATLLVNADAALYRAKSDGRGAIRFFDADMDKRLRERRALQHDLRLAVERGELILYYQPQTNITGQILGFEALVRWQHPARGMVPPSDFIPLAEESSLIIAIGEWVLTEACREAASWTEPLQIAVNLSPVQFRHGDLPELVRTVLFRTGLPAQRLELEVTEGVLVHDFTRAVNVLRHLKALGVRIAMDDFGTGYSSLSYLHSFPFDKIKIDRSFVANLDRGVQSAAIIRAVISLGRGLDLPVLAEGVETASQLAFLQQEECSEVQGYFFGRPAPISEYATAVGAVAVTNDAARISGTAS